MSDFRPALPGAAAAAAHAQEVACLNELLRYAGLALPGGASAAAAAEARAAAAAAAAAAAPAPDSSSAAYALVHSAGFHMGGFTDAGGCGGGEPDTFAPLLHDTAFAPPPLPPLPPPASRGAASTDASLLSDTAAHTSSCSSSGGVGAAAAAGRAHGALRRLVATLYASDRLF